MKSSVFDSIQFDFKTNYQRKNTRRIRRRRKRREEMNIIIDLTMYMYTVQVDERKIQKK